MSFSAVISEMVVRNSQRSKLPAEPDRQKISKLSTHIILSSLGVRGEL
jgi:hypothetical protein